MSFKKGDLDLRGTSFMKADLEGRRGSFMKEKIRQNECLYFLE